MGIKKITAKMLKKAGACPSGLKAFSKAFPKGADITVGNALRGMNIDYDLEWFEFEILTAKQRTAVKSAYRDIEIDNEKQDEDRLELMRKESYEQEDAVNALEAELLKEREHLEELDDRIAQAECDGFDDDGAWEDEETVLARAIVSVLTGKPAVEKKKAKKAVKKAKKKVKKAKKKRR